MPQLLALVGKALGSILRGPGGTESIGRNRTIIESEGGFDGLTRREVGTSPAPEPSLRQRSSFHNDHIGVLCPGAPARTDLFGAAERSAEAAIATAVASDSCGGSPGRNCSAGDASTSTAAAATGASTAATAAPVQYGSSDASSPPAVHHFFRASRASLSDTTTAGEALRQASVTTCKHFTRENYNNYVRWVRATRGAMKLAGRMRSREAACRNPNPTLLLRCEHWLEVTDEQHRYGSNLRVYFDYWVAEMEAAELTPPQSPALLSPSPSCPHLVALAQQQLMLQQQQQLACAIDCAASKGRTSAIDYQRPQQRAFSEAQLQVQGWNVYLKPMPAMSQDQLQMQPDRGLPGPQQAVAAAEALAVQCAGPSPGPSRFSSDASATPRLSFGAECRDYGQHQQQQQQKEQQELPEEGLQQQRNGPDGRVQKLNYRRTHHHYHYYHQHAPAALDGDKCRPQAGGRREEQVEMEAEGAGDGDRLAAGGCVISSNASHNLWDGSPQQPNQQEAGKGQRHAHPHPPFHVSQHHHFLHDHHHRNNHNGRRSYQHHDLNLCVREGSVQQGEDDGAPSASLPVCLTANRSHDGDGDDEPHGRIEPLSPPGAADAMSCGNMLVRCVAGSCDPPPTLLQRRQMQQQRRRSCGESDAAAATRHPAATQPRPSADSISIMSITAAAAQPQQPSCPVCSSPRRSVLCSPSRRFMLAAMIDMSAMDGQQPPETPQLDDGDSQKQQEQQSGQEAQCSGEPAAQAGLHDRQLPHQGGLPDVADPTAAAGIGCCGASGAMPPTTPPPPLQQLQVQSSMGGTALTPPLPPATAALTDCGGACGVSGDGRVGVAPGSWTAQRPSKQMPNRASVGSGTSFFRWLDSGPGLDVDLAHVGVSRAKLDTERVKYLAPDELLEYELDVDMDTGLLRYKRSGKLLHTGHDGRGSLDEHRRPPTPPPPAVPLPHLSESAAAWWRGSGAVGVADLPTLSLPSSCFQAAGAAVAAAGAPPLPPRSLPAAARHAFRRISAMSTVREGSSGEGASGEGGCSVAPRQNLLAGNAANGAAAAAVMADADTGDGAQQGLDSASLEAFVAAEAKLGAGGGGGWLPDLELRGHSASSLARLEPSRNGDCYSTSKACDFGAVTVPGAISSRNSVGDSGGSSRPCSSTDAGAATVDAATAAAALSISAGEGSSSGRGVEISLAAEAQKDDGPAVDGTVLDPGVGDAAAAAATVARKVHPEAPPRAPPLQLPSIQTAARPEAPMPKTGTPSAAAAAAAAAGGSVFGCTASQGGLSATSSMPRTPVAAQTSGGGFGGYHYEEKVAKWIYVVDPELRLFVHPKVRGRFHHSSFLRGGAVVAAGGLAARHGRLRLLTADSGHYWPREENFRWLCEHLVYVGADLSVCELRSKHMPVPAATGKELMEKMGVPPPWRLPYQPALSPSGRASIEPAAEAEAPPSPLAEHMHLLQLQGTSLELEAEPGEQCLQLASC